MQRVHFCPAISDLPAAVSGLGWAQPARSAPMAPTMKATGQDLLRSFLQGVRIDIGSGRSEKIAADLVVDASGRGALTLALLDAVDWQRPEVTEVGVDLSYVSAVVEIPPDPPPEWKLAVIFPKRPEASSWSPSRIPDGARGGSCAGRRRRRAVMPRRWRRRRLRLPRPSRSTIRGTA